MTVKHKVDTDLQRVCFISVYGNQRQWNITGWWCNNHLETYKSTGRMTSHILWKIKNAPNHQPDHQLWIVRIGRISDCHVFYYAEGHQARVLSATGHFGHGRLPHREAKEEGPNRFLGDVDPWW